MSDDEALLAAIRLNPDEDMPRLMYADWLDEHLATAACPRCVNGWVPPQHGGFAQDDYAVPGLKCAQCKGTGRKDTGNANRAAFIRFCCDLSRQGKWKTGTEEWYRVRQMIVVGRREGWFNFGIPTPLDPTRSDELFWPTGDTNFISATTQRGFLHSIAAQGNDWTKWADAILALNPVQEVTLINWIGMVKMRGRNGTGVYVRFGDRPERYIKESVQPRRYHDFPLRGMLELEWPTVRKWNFPPEPQLSIANLVDETMRRMGTFRFSDVATDYQRTVAMRRLVERRPPPE